MSSPIAIRVSGLGKAYRLGTLRQAYGTFRDLVSLSFRRFGGRHGSPSQPSIIWALRDVELEVSEGEVLGLIGRNGAGKSTLLKILSRITPPTEGRIEILGRVGALLEVGAGFHPELTGRENIFLNGSILGMKRHEIRSKLADIIEFSGIDAFIDTPVKRYSSGMYVRLAFSVAAHMEPDILLVDEVLAVGDAAFQARCLGKIDEVTSDGRTVVFVSHNMAAIQGLCHRAVLLTDGRIQDQGPPEEVIRTYLDTVMTQDLGAEADLSEHPRRRPGSEPVLRQVRLSADGGPASIVQMGGRLAVEIDYARDQEIHGLRVGLAVESALGMRVMVLSPTLHAPDLLENAGRCGTLRCEIPEIPLLPGLYHLTVIVGAADRDLDAVDQATSFTVASADVFGTGQAPGAGHGIVYQRAEWTIVSPSAKK
jgi:lipopolysaccharide transport system ATP-binding protein